MKSQQGFVLIMVLLTLMVMMLLTLSQWQSLLLFQRMTGRVWEQEDALKLLEDNAVKVWTSYQADAESRGEIGEVEYQFEKIGIYPCIQIRIEGLDYSTEHIQLKMKSASGSLILRLAKPIPALPCPSKTYRYITSPILSWHYFSSGIGRLVGCSSL